MKNYVDNKTKKYLESISTCEKCKTKMKAIEVPLRALEPKMIRLIVGLGVRYQLTHCSKCGNNGMHLL